jgi:hypothetical protein
MSQLVPVNDVLSFAAMSHEHMTQHHLGHTDRATPTTVRSVADLKISADIAWQGVEPLCNLFLVSHQKWLEPLSVAEPDQRVEMHLELCCYLFDLGLEVSAFRVNSPFGVALVEQVNWKVGFRFDIDLLGHEKLDK